jgi:formyl-CoA transferase
MSLLQGCRVLDLGIITAGAATSAILADFGAEVIKVESPTYRDPFRLWAGDGQPSEDGALPPHFRATNRNKLAISIDLKRPEGRDVFLRLVGKADVVVENFRRGVLGNLGLAFEALKTANPGIVLASVSSQGESGPDASLVSYGSTLEALSGLAWVTGYADGRPEVSGRDVNYPDQIVAMFAAGMIATALRSVRDGGPGVHLDISQRDLAAFLIGDAFVAASSGREARRQGNAQEPFPLQDCFQANDGEWVAVTVTEGDLPNLARLASKPHRPDALREVVAAGVAARSATEAVGYLSDLGIRAARVLDGFGVLAKEGTLWSHAMQRSDRGMIKGFPFQIEEAPFSINRNAPLVGEHTREVLAGIGGYSASEIDALAADGVVEVAPA